MKKRILSCLMALALCLTLLPATALAVGDGMNHESHTGATELRMDGTTLKKNGSEWNYEEINVSNSSSRGYLLDGGTYYLNSNLDLADYPILIKGNVTLCLNGKTITYKGTDNRYAISLESFKNSSENAYLTLTDCENNAGTIKGGSHPAVFMQGNTKLDMYGGTLTGSSKGVNVGSDCTFNMYGGKITGNNGRGVVIDAGGTFDMSGGTISGNIGGVFVDGGTFTMNDTASITDNTATGDGGGVYVRNGGSFNMHSGTITGNDANGSSSNGGGVYVTGSRSKFTMTNGSITGNTATGNGGGVHVEGGTFTMNDGTIGGTIEGAANTATGNGGGVYVKGTGVSVSNNGTFTMNKNASVTGNTAKNGGGVYVKSGKFEMNDNASVSSNTASGNTADQGNGGGVYVKSGTFEMNYSASVTGNTATNTGSTTNTTYGGGVYVSGTKSTFEMNGTASITDNTATNGGGVYVNTDSQFNMNGDASITGNTANGVCVNAGATFTVSGKPTVTGNTGKSAAEDDASNVYLTGSNTTITIGAHGLDGSSNSIGVTKSPAGVNSVIATGAKEDYSGKFFVDNKQFKVGYDKTTQQLVLKKEETPLPAHEHKWTYKANEATITATCTGEGVCNVNHSFVRITPPGDLIYNDEAKYATVERSDNWEPAFPVTIVISYYKLVGGSYEEMVNEAPTEVGKYKASITVGDKIAFVEYEITSETTPPILVTKITLSPASPKLKVGQTQAMTVVIEPQTATKKDVIWTSSDNSVATVNTKGTVTAHKAGTAEITATAEDDSKVSATCKVTVTDDTTTGGGSTGGGSSSGGSSGGSSSGGSSSSDRDSYDSNPIIKTETKNNPDGSTTKTETRKDGSVTATTTGKDGGVSKTETKKDGSSVTENKAADGSIGTVKTDKNGQTEAKTALSNKAVEDAKKNGEAVKAPVEVEASRDSSTAPTVKVELPKGAGETKVEIPVSNVKPGTVAVLVHPDGTEEILKDSIPTEDGIQLTVDGSATVKIVDNSKDFIDTRNHWAREEIDFVSARELVNGVSDTIYAPNASATRAQLWTILARQNDTDLSGGANWYERAQLWSKDKGISDGTEPNAAINRAQMVTMLWRTMGQPTATDKVSFADVPAGSYYAQAVAWAVESGITAGVGGGRFDPSATCTRAQIAAFLARSMK